MKKIILLSFLLLPLLYSQGVRSINGQQQSTQKITSAYDDTASYFRWSATNGVHTLYIPYNLSPTIDTGGISSLNGLVTSTQVFATDTAIQISPYVSSSGSTHTFHFPMTRINNKLNSADTTTFRTRSDSLYNRTDLTDIVTAPDYNTARQYFTSIGVDTLISYTHSGNVVVNDSLKVNGNVAIGKTNEGAALEIKSINAGAMRLYGVASTNYWQATTSFNYTDVDLVWFHKITEKFRWDSSGNYMLGLTPADLATTARLGVKNNAINTSLFYFLNSRNTPLFSGDSSGWLYGRSGYGTLVKQSGAINVDVGLVTSTFNSEASAQFLSSGGGNHRVNIISNGGSPFISFFRGGGTNSAITAVGDAQILGGMAVNGHDGITYVGSRATLFAITSQAWTASANGTYFRIATTEKNTTTNTSRLWITDRGNLVLGGASTDSTARLYTKNNALSPYLYQGVNSRGTIGIWNDSSFNSFRAGNDSTTGKGTFGDTLRSGNYTTYSYFIPGGALVQSSDSTSKSNILPFTANLANFSIVTPRTYNFRKENFILPFDSKSVPDSIDIQIDSVTTKRVSNKSTKNALKLEHDTKENIKAERLASVNHAGFLAQEFNQKMFGKNSNEIRQEDIINILWAKVQELEKRIEKLEKK